MAIPVLGVIEPETVPSDLIVTFNVLPSSRVTVSVLPSVSVTDSPLMFTVCVGAPWLGELSGWLEELEEELLEELLSHSKNSSQLHPVRAPAASAADRMNAIGRLKRMICLLCTKSYTFPICGPIVPFAVKRLTSGAFSCILSLQKSENKPFYFVYLSKHPKRSGPRLCTGRDRGRFWHKNPRPSRGRKPGAGQIRDYSKLGSSFSRWMLLMKALCSGSVNGAEETYLFSCTAVRLGSAMVPAPPMQPPGQPMPSSR